MAAAATLLICLAAPSAAYTLSGYRYVQASPGAPVSLTYSYSNLFDGGLRNASGQSLWAATLRGAIEEALGLWASVAPLRFYQVPDSGPAPGDTDYSATGPPIIRIGHHAIDGRGAAKAHAYYPPPFRNGLASDVHFDNAEVWASTVGSSSRPDVLGAAIHELGHALGLGHTSDPQASMNATFRRMAGPGTGVLSGDDVAGIRALYGAGVGSVTPLPIGDFNVDGAVDDRDLPSWQTAFLAGGNADADNDGDSDGGDLLHWQRRLGARAAVVNSAIAVPEPASAILGTIAAAFGNAALRRRQFAARGRRG